MGKDTNFLAQYLPLCAKQSTLRKPKHTERGFRAETCLFPLAMNVKENVTSIVNSVEITITALYSAFQILPTVSFSVFIKTHKQRERGAEGQFRHLATIFLAVVCPLKDKNSHFWPGLYVC